MIWFQLDSSSPSSSPNGVRHDDLVTALPLNSHFDHFDECLIHRDAFLSARLEIKHVVVFSTPCASFLLGYLALVGSVHLVADEDEGEAFGVVGACVFDKTILPFVKCIEAGWIGKVKAQRATISPSIKCKAETLEFLLACRIPNLQRDHLTVDLDFLLGEVRAYGRLRVGGGLLVHVLLQQSRFAHS